MILVDTSVWVDHFRVGDKALTDLLLRNRVVAHPFVIGELACGNLKDRNHVLGLLANLPKAAVASEQEILLFIEKRQLMGRGIGFIDVHLLAAVFLSEDLALWTKDKRLAALAEALGVGWKAK